MKEKLPYFSWNRKQQLRKAFAIFVLVFMLFSIINGQASAVSVPNGYMRLDRMKTSTATSGLVCMKPATTASTTLVKVTFPSGYTVNTTAANWTVGTTNIPAGTTAWPSIATATSATSPANVVTFPSGALASTTTMYCFTFAGASTLTTGSSAAANDTGKIQTFNGATPQDSVTYATTLLANDQVVVNASVGPTFTFTLSANTTTFATNLPITGDAEEAPDITGTVSTNAQAGWTSWVSSATKTLTSAVSGGSIAFGTNTYTTGAGNCQSITNNTGYGLTVTVTGGGSPATEYLCHPATPITAGIFNTLLEPVASHGAPSSGDTFVMHIMAEASGTTPAASDYTDTLNVVASANF